MKMGSRSLTMEHEMPCGLTILSKKTLATETVVYGCFSGMNWVYLKKRSTTVRTTDFRLPEGSPQ
jgi:hypothetical protein